MATLFKGFRKANSLRKQIRQVIRQGNNNEIQRLFQEIVVAAQEEFTEDNIATMAGFLAENLFNAFSIRNAGDSSIAMNAMISSIKDAHFQNNRL